MEKITEITDQYRSTITQILVCYIFSAILFFSCSKSGGPVPVEVKKSSDKSITSFAFKRVDNAALPEDYTGTITGNTITISIPSNIDISGLKASFTSSSKSLVRIGQVIQQDKLTTNNFTSPQIYTVTAEDGSTQNYTISVVCSDKALITFLFAKSDNPSLNEDCVGMITGCVINVLLSSSADLSTLKATYTASPKVTVKVGNLIQQSKNTINSFAQPVVYSIIAEDGSKQDYTVNVVKKSSEKAFLVFGLTKADNPNIPADITGIISGTTVKIIVPYNTNLSSFKATFTNSPKSIVKIGNTEQQDKVTINDFTAPVIYSITAEDGTSINYTVSITCAPNSAKDLLSFGFLKTNNSSLPYDVIGIVEKANQRIICTIPAGVNRTNLIATFTLSDKASAKVGPTIQISGSTPNNFISNITYTVVAEDGGVINYTIEILGESLPVIVQSRIDNKILALNLHSYPYYQTNLFSGVEVVPIYSTTFISQKPSNTMPFDAGYIGSDGKIYVTTPYTSEQKAVFKDATHAAIYYMCQLFLSNYYLKTTFPIWFKYGMAAFEAGLTISDDDIKSAIMKYGGQLPSLTTLNDPTLFADNQGIAIAKIWGEFMAVNKCWQYNDIIDVSSQTVVVAPYWSGVESLDNLYSIWKRYIDYRILETNNQNRGRLQIESEHFKFYCADKDAFCISGFTDIIETAYSEYTSLLNISFPEKLTFGFGPECEIATRDGVQCSNRYTGGTGWVSGMACSSPSTLNDMYRWNHLLRHEFAHSVVFRLYPRSFQPTAWLSEGAAEFLANGILAQNKISEIKPSVREAMRIATNNFGHRPNYDDTKIYPGDPYYDYYLLGQTLMNFIYQKGGYTGVKNVLSDAENGFKSLGFANHDEFMNAYYTYYDTVWNN